ncbi:GTP diphosphokinase [Psychromonas sp. 14N.309.X.WAT.B.A12]|uniref:GTP diphosphokinase n=1 Tax=unclassified Psychromonas TaxID=2614957 RepID=UPI0025AEF57C|nr:GTP diphosphokinase [Psychromonas sp. 14N.309.X.WAT.B.A12]MDN2664167.1 GTP diphosphokinase [Psychromonas sp. 14N.309.X.WAT.B.A12]
MVSVRDTHFYQSALNDPDKWVTTFGLSKQDQNNLFENYNKVSGLCDSEQQVAALQLGCEMVEILVTLNMDMDTLNAALIFPLLAQEVLSTEKVDELWPKRIAKLAKGAMEMEGIRALQSQGSKKGAESQVDNLRHMLLAMVEDVRAVVIKLAERICYLRQVKIADEETKVKLAHEISTIYAPLANRLGIGQLKWELEDLSFRYLQADTYKNIAKQLDEKRIDRENYIQDFVDTVKTSLKEMNIEGTAYGRPKHIYSIYRKMQNKDLKFDELYDVRAVRVVVEKLQDCYAALGAIHTKWHHIPREFDDYIANPKPNGYQSIHTVVLGDSGKPVEVQIRTQQMHEDSELGVAAHWKYKEGSAGGKAASNYEEKIAWLRKLLAWQEDMSEGDDLVEEIRSQVFDDRVYVFTPKGEVIDLPAGSTPLDFAYYIHSQIGHRCIGAKVANHIVPFTYQLKTGDQIEILTQKEPNPSRDWLNPQMGYINAPRARHKVATWFRKQDRDKNIIAGRELLEVELAKVELKLADVTPAITRFNVGTADDIYAGIGNGDLRINQLVHFLDGFYHKQTLEQQDAAALLELQNRKVQAAPKNTGKDIIIDGVGNLMHHIARCCQPVPGENIVGYITQGRGISIHRKNCEQLADLEDAHPERIITANWGDSQSSGYSLTLRLIADDRNGLLKDITTLLSNEKVNLLGVNSQTNTKTLTATIDLSLEVDSNKEIKKLLAKLKQLKDVSDAHRL